MEGGKAGQVCVHLRGAAIQAQPKGQSNVQKNETLAAPSCSYGRNPAKMVPLKVGPHSWASSYSGNFCNSYCPHRTNIPKRSPRCKTDLSLPHATLPFGVDNRSRGGQRASGRGSEGRGKTRTEKRTSKKCVCVCYPHGPMRQNDVSLLGCSCCIAFKSEAWQAHVSKTGL